MSRERTVKLLESQNVGDIWKSSFSNVRKIYINCPRGSFQIHVKNPSNKEIIYSQAVSGVFNGGLKGGKGGDFDWGDIDLEVNCTVKNSEIKVTVETE
jgi:hypothetical protein